jgi:hypothetical protein
MKKMQPEEVLITPQMAKWLLQFNIGNRNLPVGNAKYYAELIKNGEFLTTHQALAFTGDMQRPKRLLDGQTRLTAIIDTGIPVKQWIFWNAPEVTFQAIDGGKPRSFSDHNPEYTKQSIALVNIFFWLSKPCVRKITKTDADKIYDVFGPYFDMLMDSCPTARKGISCAAVRAAFCLTMKENESSAKEIALIYRNMVLEKLENTPVSANRLFIKLLSVVGGGMDAMRVQFPFTHKAMTPKNWGLTKLYGPEESYFQDLSVKIKNYCSL